MNPTKTEILNLHNDRGQTRDSRMSEVEYYCHNCSAKIKATDTFCPNCGKKLMEVGKRIEINLIETAVEAVKPELTKEQISIIKKVFGALKGEFDKAEIESVTLGFPQLISVKIVKKKEGRN
jgi:DNA-directed RNA polymerase subunit RPC12/RpoP